MTQRQIPGGRFVNESGTRQAQIPGGAFINETVSSGGSYTLTADSGAFAVTGIAASLKFGRNLSASSGTVSVSGTAATLNVGKLLAASTGSFIVTGTDATLTKSTSGAYTLNCASGVYAVSGVDATLALGRILSASSGSVIVTGTPATLNAAKRLLASSGAFSVTGTDATLIYANFNHYTLNCAPGEIDVTGFAASLNFTPEAGDKTGGDDYPLRVVHKKRKKTLEEQPNLHLESIIEKAVKEVFGEEKEVLGPPLVDVNKNTSKVLDDQKTPFVNDKPKIPEFEGIKALADSDKDAQKVGELLALYQQQVKQAQMQDDEDLLMLIIAEMF